MVRKEVPVSSLLLPRCAIPRPGDSVVWYQGYMPFRGSLIGHKADGRPYIINEFGNLTIRPSFQFIRHEDPNQAVGPNWSYLTSPAKIFYPHEHEISDFDEILSQRTPPGPQYNELVTEIWSRGFEVFVVGGTVRDVIGKQPTKDVDLVTTMPLVLAKPLLQSMYQYHQSPKKEARALANGHIQLGGRPGSGDPTIDLCVFKLSLPGDADATFGADFNSDVAHRDFACNAVYYDPINKVLIDPTGIGVANAEGHILTLVCDRRRRSAYNIGQLTIRFFKFLSRGYSAPQECCDQIGKELVASLSAMHASGRARYIRTQVLKKYPRSEHAARLDEFQKQFVEFGASEAWNRLIEPHRDDILKI